MAPTASKILSADQFWELPEKPGLWLELVDGAAIETSGSTWLHAELVMHIFSLLREYVRDRNLVRFPDGLTYLLQRDPDTMRIPDTSFVPRSGCRRVALRKGSRA
ncbi:MAG: Uma2 family endonuclease [Thermomicrobiales bacterium]